MRAIWLLLRTEAARWKRKQSIGFLAVLIIIMIGTVCYVREQEIIPESGKIVLGVAKEDTSEYANLLMKYFNENEEFLKYVELIEADEEKLQKAMEAGGMDAYLVIPERFAESMIEMENLPIRSVVSMKNPTKALALRYVMEAYETYIEAVEVNCTALYRKMKEEGFSSDELNAANMEISLELIFTALGKDDLFRKNIVEVAEEDKTGLSLADHYKLTALYFVLLFLFLPAGLRVIELRQSGMTARMRTMNISVGSVLTAVGLPYLVCSAAALVLFCHVEEKQEVLYSGILYILPWLFVMLCLGSMCKSSQTYLFVCSMILVCLAVFGGSLIPEQFLPDSFQTVARWMPNRNFTFVMGGVQP